MTCRTPALGKHTKETHTKGQIILLPIPGIIYWFFSVWESRMLRLIGAVVFTLVVCEGVYGASNVTYINTTAASVSNGVDNTTTTPRTTTKTTLTPIGKTQTTTKTTYETLTTSTSDGPPYCAAYCDVFGYYNRKRFCPSNFFCCGDLKYRYCCNSPKRRLPVDYPDVKSCPNSAWWLFHWRVIVGLLGTVMVIMMCGACVYYCCLGLCRKNPTVQRVRRRLGSNPESQTMNTVSDGPRGSDPTRSSFTFDPSNPNAFTPPPYDSLPKDPPKYADLFDGQDNRAFEGENGAQGPTASTSGDATVAAVVVGATAAAAAAATITAVDETEASSATSGSGAVAPASPNRTTAVTSSAASAPAMSSMAEVAGDLPPPYTRTDPAKTPQAPPSGANGNQNPEENRAAPSGESVQRINVETAVPEQPRVDTSPV